MEGKDFNAEKVEKLTAELLACKVKIAELTAKNEKTSKSYDQSKMANIWEEGRAIGLHEAIKIILEAQSGREKE